MVFLINCQLSFFIVDAMRFINFPFKRFFLLHFKTHNKIINYSKVFYQNLQIKNAQLQYLSCRKKISDQKLLSHFVRCDLFEAISAIYWIKKWKPF
jgi:hypothetical protein